MQIDAHSETVIDWDVHMINEWYHAKNEFAVLSTYVSGTESKPKDSKVDFSDAAHEVPVLCATEWGQNGMVRNSGAGAASTLAAPMLGCLWGAGLSFSKCHAERVVRGDPHTAGVFDGEEFTKAARLWTNGYDIYNPSRALIFHNYRIAQASRKRWHGSFSGDETAKSYKRLLSLLGMKGGDPSGQTLADIQSSGYGLGNLRTLAQFEQFCHIDLVGRKPATGDNCGTKLYVPWQRDVAARDRVAEIAASWAKGDHGEEL